ncbi:aldehyde dehydrogenase family protein [Nocardia macrotermitis]|uniref:Putative aldehyde dehydrogenase n=1 Tax=Nocardia macrotermitis TaxID=2585198 RepID=A0A7K0DEQ3_9NOCA|nr:aldehyde dehydrogenase family protein [Nocardia macrotermitis]MQY24148.1 putative aldehyde dehydrogenase [Nocardia macrotermitis]
MAEILAERRSYVAGRWVTGETPFEVWNPADESVVTALPCTPIAEIERAVLEARRSFDSGAWAATAPKDRARVLHTFLDRLEQDREALVATLVAEAGQPLAFAERSQFLSGIMLARNTIDLYLSMPEEQANPVPVDELTRGRVALSIRRYEPVGVVTAITPYNAAFIMALQKIVPALLTGNSVILRPSPLTPVSSLIFGAAAEAAGLPPGVFGVVVEAGSAGAELLTSHPAVDMVSFTGSTAIGAVIAAQAAPTIKRVALELGGKSAQIYLPDAVSRAGAGAAAVVGGMAGQACVAATRMLVPHEAKEQVLEQVSKVYAGLKVGAPTDPATSLGPVISAAQRARCEHIIAEAVAAGATVRQGGRRPPEFERGYYFQPTVLDLPDNSNPAAQQEIFGPVLSVIGYRDLDDAVTIANDSRYGLSAQVYSADPAAATAVARRLRTGAVNVNTAVFSAYAPSGGYKHSGLGRERGPDGIRAFQEVKHLAIGEFR